MLLGTYPAKIVAGRRAAVPSLIRKELGQKYILARWYEGCLVLIDIKSWLAMYKRLVGDTKVIVSPIRDTERFILGSAFEVVPDEQGRIVIPERLLEYSEINEDIYFIGLGDRVEIWDKQKWEQREAGVVANSADFIEELAGKNRSK